MAIATSEINMNDDIIITSEEPVFKSSESFGEFIFKALKKNSDRIAQIDSGTGQSQTFDDLLKCGIRTALHMKDLGIKPNDTISICSRNELDAIVPLIGTFFLGATLANFYHSFGVEEFQERLEFVKPKMVFLLPEVLEHVEAALKKLDLNPIIVVFGTTTNHLEFRRFLKAHNDEEVFEVAQIKNLEDIAIIFFSSGTTGTPKVICYSHRAFLDQVYNFRLVQYKGANPDRIDLITLSLFWIPAIIYVLECLHCGITRLLSRTFEPEVLWNLCKRYKISSIVTASGEIMDCIPVKPDDVNLTDVETLTLLGTSLYANSRDDLERIFSKAVIINMYGQTEAGAIASFHASDPKHQRFLKDSKQKISAGLLVPGVSLKVLDRETGKTLGPNQQGEIRVKSIHGMSWYLNADSSVIYDQDGWCKMYDIGYYDDDHCIYVLGRCDDMLKIDAAWWIKPSLLEEVLLQHFAVKQAVVIGIPNHSGDKPMGLVILKNGFQATERELEKFVEDRVLEKYRLKSGVRILEDFPTTVTGKVKRKLLLQMALDGTI